MAGRCKFEGMENYQDYISINPEVMLGKPVIKGTRITVELIIEALAAGRSTEELLENYPRLTREAISAALLFAADKLRPATGYSIAS